MSGDAAKLSTAVQFSTAGLGGIMGWIIVHPFNTVAIRMNLASTGAKPSSMNFVGFTREVVSSEGVSALYRGLSAGVVRQVFYATSRFGLFETFRDMLAKYRETDFLSRLTVGMASGACAAYISCPAEVSLVRMSNDNALPASQRRNYSSVLNAAVRIAREEGFATFWRGSTPFVMRAMLVGATQVGTFDQFKATYRRFGVPDGVPNVFCAAMSAGLIYSLITMPFETAKNRMSFQRKDPVTGQLPYRTTVQTVRTVATQEGVLSLWNGFLPYYGRCGGHTVAMFIFVHELRRIYKVYTSRERL
mmetsp:Transcript_3190/g.9725  ORF Transcript_3190/g.9725 Transcript_3190/m.9725 type:complete len:304 (-) Transcript_3190:1175-2086(-)|eukprot:CAMPEP_0198734026 /NCGR_PEP_ID=MMETSP1475-20131203/50079_1 /TAXON_ID= ORGANISM="Unidentified sp., Strain CCMP1999" /NCGR_SAMPLE_ID=MMETSP1475 /ASSEMBLY_ACC=CAM_ASM_001111 /LENGTH=303 /DNA_ID=CAMNT_0044497427 /DNA_START=41 /DNA_END=952 /DNA_ORIENTATION=+